VGELSAVNLSNVRNTAYAPENPRLSINILSEAADINRCENRTATGQWPQRSRDPVSAAVSSQRLPNTESVVRGAHAGLRESLQTLGFRDVWLAARQLREMAPEQELKFTSISFGIPADVQLLNVKV
jgi:hypothetical protein